MIISMKRSDWVSQITQVRTTATEAVARKSCRKM
jgi:hypothetical protein